MVGSSIEKRLIGLEREYWQAMKDQDAESAARLSDDPCLVTGAQGVTQLDRVTLAKMMRNGSYTLDSFDLSDPVVRWLSDNVALAYKVHEELTVDGKPVALDAADSSTWVRRDGHWLCAVHTEALAGDPFGRDRQPTAPTKPRKRRKTH